MTDGQWMTYTEAGVRLGINAEAVRRRADRGKWARMPGNDGRTRVLVPEDARAPQAPPVRAEASALASALEAHIVTLKADIERLTAELAGERAELAAERTRADGATAELKGDIARLEGDLAGERAARRVDQEQHQDQLAAERAAHREQLAAERAGRQADQEHAAARQADHEQQLAAARAAADKGTAELVELARRLAEIAEKQAAEEPEPRRSAAGRAWRWFLRN
jgi:chromosome segregation ATPase